MKSFLYQNRHRLKLQTNFKLSKIESSTQQNVPQETIITAASETVNELQEIENPNKGAELELTRNDDELDITSENFNPLRCLYAKDFRITAKQPKVTYQNMAAFETAFKNIGIWDLGRRPKTQNLQQQPGTSKQAASTVLVEEQKTQRRFQEHQMSIRTHPRIKNKHTRNILGQMAQAIGPLKAFNDYVATGRRVHVVVRKEKGIKGFIEGCVKMYDRHWNLLLSDVEECYVRQKYRYVEDNMILPYDEATEDCSDRLKTLGIELPKISIRNLNRKTIEIRRKVPQLFLRGEHVVVVYAANESKK